MVKSALQSSFHECIAVYVASQERLGEAGGLLLAPSAPWVLLAVRQPRVTGLYQSAFVSGRGGPSTWLNMKALSKIPLPRHTQAEGAHFTGALLCPLHQSLSAWLAQRTYHPHQAKTCLVSSRQENMYKPRHRITRSQPDNQRSVRA